MEKSKRIIIAVTIVTVGILFFGIYKMVNVNDDINEGEDISESENKRENNEFLGFNKEDLKTKKEIADIIDQYKSEEDLSDEDIALKLDEDYGETIGKMYRRGLMIDDDFSKEDNKQILANYIFIENLSDDNIPNQLKLKPVKEISNPIDHEFGNEEVNKFLKATDLINNTYDIDMNTYVKDTEGFYDIEGLNLGYPSVDTEFDVKDGEIMVNVSLLSYMNETLNKREAEELFNKFEDVEVNGKTLEEDKRLFANKDEILKAYNDDDNVMYEGTVMNLTIESKLNDLFEHEFETFKAEDINSLTDEEFEKANEEINKAFGLDKESIEEIPNIEINGEDMKLNDSIITREIEGEDEYEYENDFSINPEIIGSM